MPLPTLTAKERIQLHLFEYSRSADEHEAPVEATQDGIAKAVGIKVPHVLQYVRPLIAEGIVDERTGHVRRQKRRRKVYFLTERGRSHAATLRNALLKEEVPVRTRGGAVEQAPLLRLVQEERLGSSILELLQELRSDGAIGEAAKVAAPKLVDFTQEAVRTEPFYGRKEELRAVLEALERAPVVILTGMAGVGKTALAAKVCEAFRGKRSLFWRQVRPWDTAIDLAERLAVFLQSLGRPALHAHLLGSGAKELGRVEELLVEDLADLPALIVLDDVHDASENAQALLSILLRALRNQRTASALLLSRFVPDFYSRREVAIEGAVAEVPLGGLDRESSASLLADAGIGDPLIGSLVDACGGSPLFLGILARSLRKGSPAETWRTLETYIAEEIDPALKAEERGCLELASMYRLPVTDGALLLEEGVHRRTLLALQRKGLVSQTKEERFVLHDTIRAYFGEGLSTARREALSGKVIPWLMRAAQESAQRGQPDSAIAFLGNAVSIASDPSQRGTISERLGEVRRFVGDFPGAIEAYRTALRGCREPASAARLHQRIAMCFEVQGHLREAEQEVEEGLARVPGRPSIEVAWLLYQKAKVAFSRQDFEETYRQVDEVTGWMAGLPKDPALWGWMAALRGMVHLDDPGRRDPALAQMDFTESIEAFEAAKDARGLAIAYKDLALAEIEIGQVDHALAHLDESTSVSKRVGDIPSQLSALFTKAWCLTECLGEYDAAESLYEETYRLAKLTHQRQRVVYHYQHLSNLYRREGRFERAREALDYFLGASGDMLNAENRIAALALMARLCLLCGDSSSAAAHLESAAARCEQSPSGFAYHAVEWSRAMLLANRGDLQGAGESFRRALVLPAAWERGEFLLDYGRWLASKGEGTRAREILGEARLELSKFSKPLERAALEALESVESPDRA